MTKSAGIISFQSVSFEYNHQKPILSEANFVVRHGAKLTLMGQNGAGKSTIFDLITGVHTPTHGTISIQHGTSIAHARQVIPPHLKQVTIETFFAHCFTEKVYNLTPKIDDVLEIVSLSLPHDKVVSSLSGGQQARLLLASALIQNPDVLLLDEPTNNLDTAGIDHLTSFLKEYKKTVLVISHDAEFLNSFTHGVLYLDNHTHTIEQYSGNYTAVLKEIHARIEKENRKNAQYAKEIQANKEKANYFSHKGGKMRLVAKRLREEADEYEENKVDVRKEDKTIRPFTIPVPEYTPPVILTLASYHVMQKHRPVEKKCSITLRKGMRLQLVGPNGIGKTTLLESLAHGHEKGEYIAPEVRVGYYRQDFSTLDFSATVYDTLMSIMEMKVEETMRSCAAGFLLGSDVMKTKVGNLSEGQKGLVAFARLVLMKPGLLILDEPTNHINFRHIPVIADALNAYTGAMILVSHVPDFVQKIRIDEVLDLGK